MMLLNTKCLCVYGRRGTGLNITVKVIVDMKRNFRYMKTLWTAIRTSKQIFERICRPFCDLIFRPCDPIHTSIRRHYYNKTFLSVEARCSQ